MADLTVHAVPAFADNYIWLLEDRREGLWAVVDPGEAPPVDKALQRLSGKGDPPFLSHIFNTHHHGDHTGGNRPLQQTYGAKLVAPATERERITGINLAVEDGQELLFGRHKIRALAVPGHTKGHMAFHFYEAGLLFCGDALFSLGCGRMFEGTPDMMWNSLVKIRALPEDTLLYCGHEYTLDNARFALAVDPKNEALKERVRQAKAQQDGARPTVPFRLGDEKKANPFLRADDAGLQEAIGLAGAPAAAVFGSLRAAKDHF